ncbi:MAG TPA: hypothetical protein VJY35_11580 [Candidatus Eisenbacteria bacterium]|nr:hypothetical protein [Candidatus Eisenbacteria bacterium]
MKRSRYTLDHLCFPVPPARIDRTLIDLPVLPTVAGAYLNEIRRWHDTVVTALLTNDPLIAHIEHLTTRARTRLVTLLQIAWDVKTRNWAASSNYALVPFPSVTPLPRRDDPMEAVLEVLRWRAAVVDYITDVWDVLGQPELDMGECAAIGSFLRPARLEGRCIYCLTEYASDHVDPEDHACVMMPHASAR